MSGNDALRQTLEHYRQQRQLKLQEIQAIELLIRQIEKDLGEPMEVQAETQPLDTSAQNGVRANPMRQGMPDLRADEFYGQSQTEAAKAYLKKIRHAVPLDQLVEALRKGGAQVGGANPKRTLYVSLVRNPLREFVFIGDENVGLREFYPNLPKSGNPRGSAKRTKRTKLIRKPKQSKTVRKPRSRKKAVQSQLDTGLQHDKHSTEEKESAPQLVQ